MKEDLIKKIQNKISTLNITHEDKSDMFLFLKHYSSCFSTSDCTSYINIDIHDLFLAYAIIENQEIPFEQLRDTIESANLTFFNILKHFDFLIYCKEENLISKVEELMHIIENRKYKNIVKNVMKGLFHDDNIVLIYKHFVHVNELYMKENIKEFYGLLKIFNLLSDNTIAFLYAIEFIKKEVEILKVGFNFIPKKQMNIAIKNNIPNIEVFEQKMKSVNQFYIEQSTRIKKEKTAKLKEKNRLEQLCLEIKKWDMEQYISYSQSLDRLMTDDEVSIEVLRCIHEHNTSFHPAQIDISYEEKMDQYFQKFGLYIKDDSIRHRLLSTFTFEQFEILLPLIRKTNLDIDEIIFSMCRHKDAVSQIIEIMNEGIIDDEFFIRYPIILQNSLYTNILQNVNLLRQVISPIQFYNSELLCMDPNQLCYHIQVCKSYQLPLSKTTLPILKDFENFACIDCMLEQGYTDIESYIEDLLENKTLPYKIYLCKKLEIDPISNEGWIKELQNGEFYVPETQLLEYINPNDITTDITIKPDLILDSVLEIPELQPYEEGLVYRFDDTLISKNKVRRLYTIYNNMHIESKEALQKSIFYNTILNEEEKDTITSLINQKQKSNKR